MSQGDIETATIFTRGMRKIQGKISALVSDISTNTSDIAISVAGKAREDLLKQATLSLDFVNNKYEVYEGPVNSLTQMPFNTALDFTRASTATARTATGKIQEVLTDEQRLVGNREGLLIEEQRTNLLLWSENFTDGLIWVRSNATLQGNVAKNIDGSMTADLLSTDTTTSQHRIRQDISGTSGVTYCGSVYAKAGTERFISLVFPAINDVFLVDVNTIFDLVTGEYSIGPDAVSAGAVYVGGGFYLCYVTVQAQATDTSAFDIRITDSLVNRVGTTNGTGAENVILGAAQVEEGSFPTSYIPTAGTQVTRAADNCSRALGQEYTSTGVTFFGEVVLEENYTLMRIFSCSSAAGGRNGMHLTSEGMGQFQAQVLGVPNTLLNGTVPFSKTTKYSYSVDPNGVLAFSINGSYFETPFISELSTLENVEINLGYYFENNNQYINSPISSLSMLPRAATEAEHITLTGGT
jgi:hypothetical protein